MDSLLGLLLLAGYITGIVALASGITYATIRIFPTKDRKKDKKNDEDKPATPSDGIGAGRLFRRSKREPAD